MKCVVTSDTHFEFDSTLIPEGDVLFHTGDLMYRGTPDEWFSRVESLARQPHRYKFYVPGNHDYFPEHYEGVAVAELRRKGIVMLGTNLNNMLTLFQGKKILALPWVTGLVGWAYNANEDGLDRLLENIGVSPDLVLTHAPPFRILDSVPSFRGGEESAGCIAYKRWFDHSIVKPKTWAFGHIHEGYGRKTIDGCEFLNASMCDRKYEQVNPALEFEL